MMLKSGDISDVYVPSQNLDSLEDGKPDGGAKLTKKEDRVEKAQECDQRRESLLPAQYEGGYDGGDPIKEFWDDMSHKEKGQFKSELAQGVLFFGFGSLIMILAINKYSESTSKKDKITYVDAINGVAPVVATGAFLTADVFTNMMVAASKIASDGAPGIKCGIYLQAISSVLIIGLIAITTSTGKAVAKYKGESWWEDMSFIDKLGICFMYAELFMDFGGMLLLVYLLKRASDYELYERYVFLQGLLITLGGFLALFGNIFGDSEFKDQLNSQFLVLFSISLLFQTLNSNGDDIPACLRMTRKPRIAFTYTIAFSSLIYFIISLIAMHFYTKTEVEFGETFPFCVFAVVACFNFSQEMDYGEQDHDASTMGGIISVVILVPSMIVQLITTCVALSKEKAG